MKGKKGELTTTEIAVIIILIVSIGAIIWFYYSIDFKGEADWQACHLAITQRGFWRIGDTATPGPNSIPLRCTTEKYCLGKVEKPNKNLCEANLPTTKENPVNYYELKSGSTREEYLDFLSEQLYNCHALVGEGKVNFMPPEWYDQKYCLICSRFDIDPQIKKEFGEVTYLELFKKLSQKTAPSGKSYLEEIYKATDAEKAIQFAIDQLKERTEEQKDWKRVGSGLPEGLTAKNWKIDLTQGNGGSIITMNIKGGTSTEWMSTIAVGAAVVIGATSCLYAGCAGFAAVPLAVAIVHGVAISATIAAPVYIYGTVDDEYYYVPPTIVPYEIDNIRSLGCNSFETAP